MREIIIKIPDTAYEGILNADKAGGNWREDLLGILCNAITHGTLIPEGHGRLIDGNKIRDEIDELDVLRFSSGERIYKDEVLDIIDKYRKEVKNK